jgi:L-cysteine S-thiosulfotransferase
LPTLRTLAATLTSIMVAAGPLSAKATAAGLASYTVSGDGIAAPLDGAVGDPVRGRKVVLNRETGNCLICHRVPEPNEPFQGTLGPDLKDVGGRLDAGQLRLRLVDQTQLNPATLMPPYYRIEGLTRVAARFRGKPVLEAQEIEDVVAYLLTLK